MSEKIKTKKYKIHNNRTIPYIVEVHGKTVSILKNKNPYDETLKDPFAPFLTLKTDEIFPGKRFPMTNSIERTPIGNTVLLKISNKYMFIGHEIYEFSPVKGDVIEKYYSDMGGNDIPYPFAVGKTHIYIMLDKVAIEKSYFDMKKDIYEQHYYQRSVDMCLKGNPKTDICKDKSVYEPRIAEWKAKQVKLKTKKVD